MNKKMEQFCWDNYHHLVSQYDKLYKENEVLKKEIKELKKPKYIIDCYTNKITKIDNEFVSKDKIRNKILNLELKNKVPIRNEFVMTRILERNFQIEILKELLEEDENAN